jgi:hypothetical protein
VASRNRSKDGHIYLAKGDNSATYKIGKTIRPTDERLKQHRTSDPSMKFIYVFTCCDPSGAEAFLLKAFESKRVLGSKESFDLDEHDLQELPRLIGDYERFASLEVEVDKLKRNACSLRFISPDICDEEDCVKLREIREKKARLEFEEQMIEWRMMLKIGSNAGLIGLASWKSSSKPILDQTALKLEEPIIYERFLKQSIRRIFRLL